ASGCRLSTRPPTPRTDTWAIPVPHNCGGAAAAASRTSPRLKVGSERVDRFNAVYENSDSYRKFVISSATV
ncbi:MAG: hypothetical protein WCB26_10680, partial [Pseudolabrys sp.]